MLPALALGAWFAAGAAFLGRTTPVGLLAAAGLGCVGLIVAGVVLQGSGIFARPLMAVRTARPELALTFDDGPDAEITPAVMAALEAGGHRGTFFVVGERAAAQPALTADIARRGHGLENHSLRHAYTTNLRSPKALAEELRQASEIVARATGAAPRWFRPPVGLLSPRIAEGVRRAGLELVGWTASARDGVARRQVQDAVRRLERHLVPGAILVMHDGRMGKREGSIAVPVLEQVLARMAEKGLRSVTLPALLAPDAPAADAPARS